MDQETTTPRIEYELGPNNRILGSSGGKLTPSRKALPENAIGSIDWLLQRMCGDREKAIELLESCLVEGDVELYQFCAVYRQWQEDFQNERLDQPPNFNQVAFRLKLNEEFISAKITQGMLRIAGKLSTVRASQLAPQVIEAAGQFAMEPEGYKDRELVLKVSGVIADTKGPIVNVNQQVGVKVETKVESPEALSKRFAETFHQIDEAVREDVFTQGNREE